jgi:AraC-like DNA-binding protein
MFSDFSRIIDTISVQFRGMAIREAVRPVELEGIPAQSNILLQLNKGHLFAGADGRMLNEGQLFLIPAGHTMTVKHGFGDDYTVFKNWFGSNDEREFYVKTFKEYPDFSRFKEVFSVITFDLYIYDTISLFELIELPPIALPEIPGVAALLHNAFEENKAYKIGNKKVLDMLSQQIVILFLRYLDSSTDNIAYKERLQMLLDRRIVHILQFINGNLANDLSNGILAKVGMVSEEYVGQYFKNITGMNLQDYVESQRLEKARFLLISGHGFIQDICSLVGFKDPAYFSRRFKLKFGENAKDIRKNEKTEI